MQPVLDYLYGLTRFGIKLGLDEIIKLVGALENPQNKFKSIHIAGTNGKGSTACFIATNLQSAGYKVGLYTSPHLIRFNERIKINNKEISDSELVRLTKKLKVIVEKEKIQTTFFEFTTALAFEYFAEQKVDFAIIETGLGGRLDATNILRPEISVITNISIDHTKHLGKTKLKIASEKAGIIKEKSIVVTAETDKRVIKKFKEICNEKKSEFYVLDHELKAKINRSDFESQLFTVSGLINTAFEIKQLGECQIKNALLSLLVADLLNIPLGAMKEGLRKSFWKGRLEIIQKDPLVIVDGAHNVEGMKSLVQFIKPIKCKKVLLLGTAEDKEISKMLKLIVPLVEKVVLTQGNFKPASLKLLEKEVKKYNKEVYLCPDIRKPLILVYP